jgi:hypothetical protein
MTIPKSHQHLKPDKLNNFNILLLFKKRNYVHDHFINFANS